MKSSSKSLAIQVLPHLSLGPPRVIVASVPFRLAVLVEVNASGLDPD